MIEPTEEELRIIAELIRNAKLRIYLSKVLDSNT